MSKPRKSKTEIEFGDFQTPDELARLCCSLLTRRGIRPAAILEPTCGRGSFLAAALQAFPKARRAVGIEINADYLDDARSRIRRDVDDRRVIFRQEDFFSADWETLLAELPDPLLIVGNPPWVTNSELGALGSANLPAKSNFQHHTGIAALTGKSNFDISEWMLIRALEWINGREATLAVLCKATVARKALLYAWSRGFQIRRAESFRVDAHKYFGAAVDARFLVVTASPGWRSVECLDHDELTEGSAATVFGICDGQLVADTEMYRRWAHLRGGSPLVWRSGIKHDCAKVLELRREGNLFRNGLDELVELEPHLLFPMLKSSEVAAPGEIQPKRWMLVTQQRIGDETEVIRLTAPKTWHYLVSHADLLDRRSSSIYKGRPKFSVFGVGEYSFAPWKVAISGFYKQIAFRAVGPCEAKPVVLDDTCYFLACESQSQAVALAELLNSDAARQFFSAFAFWDAKRPITVELLRQLNLLALADSLGIRDEARQELERLTAAEFASNHQESTSEENFVRTTGSYHGQGPAIT